MDPPSSSSIVSSSSRRLPNVVITGTPGTGKTSHAQAFLEACPFKFKHVNVGELVKEKLLHEGWNEEWDSYDVDEDRVSVGCLHLYSYLGVHFEGRLWLIL